jgi:accessory gene regulator protein AgrB
MNRTLSLVLIPLLIITSASLAFATIPIEDNSMIALASGKAMVVFTRTPTYTSNDPIVSCRFDRSVKPKRRVG